MTSVVSGQCMGQTGGHSMVSPDGDLTNIQKTATCVVPGAVLAYLGDRERQWSLKGADQRKKIL